MCCWIRVNMAYMLKEKLQRSESSYNLLNALCPFKSRHLSRGSQRTSVYVKCSKWRRSVDFPLPMLPSTAIVKLFSLLQAIGSCFFKSSKSPSPFMMALKSSFLAGRWAEIRWKYRAGPGAFGAESAAFARERTQLLRHCAAHSWKFRQMCWLIIGVIGVSAEQRPAQGPRNKYCRVCQRYVTELIDQVIVQQLIKYLTK